MQLPADSAQVAIAQDLLFWAKVQGISAAALALLGLTGILSLFLTRWGLLSQAKRSRVQDAVERCDEMAKEIVPLVEQLTTAFAASRTTMFERDAGKVTFPHEIDERRAEKAVAWVQGLSPEGRTLSLRLLNRLETWAIHFNHDLADSNVAYKPCATIYCTVVVMLYASIITLRYQNPQSGPFQNVIDLFARWYKRQRVEKIQEEVAKLEKDGVFMSTPTK